jgi:hypothetical protein
VEASLEHDDVVAFNQIHESVLAIDASRPCTLEHMAEWFGLADSAHWFAKRVFEQSINSLDHRFVCTVPVQVVSPSMRCEDQPH